MVGMEGVVFMHAGQSRGVGCMSGDAGALSMCGVKMSSRCSARGVCLNIGCHEKVPVCWMPFRGTPLTLLSWLQSVSPGCASTHCLLLTVFQLPWHTGVHCHVVNDRHCDDM